MLLIQYLQFIVFFPGGGSLLFVLLGIFVFIYDLHCCLLSLFFFLKFFWYNIHLLGGVTKFFS